MTAQATFVVETTKIGELYKTFAQEALSRSLQARAEVSSLGRIILTAAVSEKYNAA